MASYLAGPPRLVDPAVHFTPDEAMLHQAASISDHNGGSLTEPRLRGPVKMNTVTTSHGTVLLAGSAAPRFVSWSEWLQCAHIDSPFGRLYLVSCLTSTLLLLVVLNLALSAWIIASLRLHQITNPLKNLQHDASPSVQVDGILRAKTLYSDFIEGLPVRSRAPESSESSDQSSAAKRALVIEAATAGSAALTLAHINGTSGLENSLIFGENSLEIKTSNLVVESSQHGAVHTVLQVTPNELSLDGQTTQLKPSIGGMRVTAQLNTSELRSDGIHDFRIESRTDSVHLGSDQRVEVESMSGQVQLSAFDQVVLQGPIQLDSTHVHMGHLRGQRSAEQHEHAWRHHKADKAEGTEPMAYQLCLCGNGQLFAAPVDGPCQAETAICAH